MALVGTAWAGEDKAEPPLRLELDLVDGSRIIGIPGIESVPVETSYAKLNVPLKQIIAVKMSEDRETASLDLQNGDKLRGVINLEPIKLETAFGKVSVAIEHIRSLRVGRGPGASLPMRLKEGLVAYYSFDGEEGGKVGDQSGNGLDLTVIGQPVKLVAGVSGKAVLLDGSYLQAARNPLVGADAFSISLWFNTASPTENYKLVAAARWAGGNNASGWDVGTHYSEFWADNNAGSLRSTPNWERRIQFNKGEWNHLVVTCDRQRVREYINGQLAFECPANGNKVGSGVPMTVGAWMGTFLFKGLIDELRIYRRALKEDEIGSLCRALSGLDYNAIPAPRVPIR